MLTTKSELSSYIIDKTIGRGTFGKVKKALHKRTGEPVAIKILEKSKIKDITDVERVSRQLHILKLVRHSSIAQLYQIIETPDRIFMVMEYARDGQFFDFIMDGRISSEQQAHHYFAQIVSSLIYLHKLGIAHRDIKPENMLLDAKQRLKLVDFGLSNMYKTGEKLSTACGSPCYASPQMIRGEVYDPEMTDIWSLGIVLFTMVMAKLPFEDDNTSMLYSKIKSGLYLLDKKVSPQLKDLLSVMINTKPQRRLRLKDIIKHPWFVKFKQISSHGINVGFEKIPVDEDVLESMVKHNYDKATTKRYLEYNLKNQTTTTYYLFLKQKFKAGQGSQADICSEGFNQQLAQPIVRKRRHKSIDFNALAQRVDPDYVKPKRAVVSQIKPILTETHSVHSVGKGRYDSREGNESESASASTKNQFKQFNANYLSSQSKEVRSIMDRRPSRKTTKGGRKGDENDFKSVINKLVRENRRLQTENVREIYSKDVRESVKQQYNDSNMFWKKRNSNSKGNTRYNPQEKQSKSTSKKAFKSYF